MPSRSNAAVWVVDERRFRVAASECGFRNMAEVAAAAEVSKPVLYNALAGLRIRKDTAEKLAKAVGKPIDSLFAAVERPKPAPRPPPSEPELSLPAPVAKVA
jgi:hypothetical protein